jgi:hypothetical protein
LPFGRNQRCAVFGFDELPDPIGPVPLAPESIIAALMAAAAAGTISDISTARAWTGKEFKAIADKASKVAKAYRVLGKH